ncbi:hypothetical protein [Mycetocola spongiae]|uniref:hypothetical protein n=1 Tax=Mycetocola spongiae TaxID=2859226 RepID=UPI001CF3AF43|nr:hypothetical protein [Mycetocola spongiae]UCR90213.1 hypothetical protein KXZ72_06035 [Mycetocola spongiae]
MSDIPDPRAADGTTPGPAPRAPFAPSPEPDLTTALGLIEAAPLAERAAGYNALHERLGTLLDSSDREEYPASRINDATRTLPTPTPEDYR